MLDRKEVVELTAHVAARTRFPGLQNTTILTCYACRVPLLCLSLKSKMFLNENALRLISKTGPPSGQNTTVTFTYEILNSDGKDSASTKSLLELRGIAKDVFRALGGGEAFIREERRSFSNPSE